MKKKHLLISILFCSIVLSGCAKKQEIIEQSKETTAYTETIEKEDIKIESGDLAIYHAIKEKQNDFVFSPAMIKSTFSTFYNNSQGKTKETIENVFEFNDDGKNSNYNEYKKHLLSNQNDRMVAIDNIYINQNEFKNEEVPEGVNVLEMNSSNKNEEFHNIMELTDGDLQKGLPADFFEEDSKIDIANILSFKKYINHDVYDQEFGKNGNMTSVIFGSESVLNLKEIVENKMKINVLRIPYPKTNEEDENEHQFSLYVICDTVDCDVNCVDKYLRKINEEDFKALLDFNDYEGIDNCSSVEFTIPYINTDTELNFKDYIYKMGLEDLLMYGNDNLKAFGKNSITYYFHETSFRTSVPKISEEIIKLTDEEKEAIRNKAEKETEEVEEIIYSVKADSPFVFIVKDDTENQIVLMGRKNVE